MHNSEWITLPTQSCLSFHSCITCSPFSPAFACSPFSPAFACSPFSPAFACSPVHAYSPFYPTFACNTFNPAFACSPFNPASLVVLVVVHSLCDCFISITTWQILVNSLVYYQFLL